MAIEEKVVQSESVAPTDQSVTETPSQTQTQPQAPNLDSVKIQYEEQISALKKQIIEGEEKFKGAKSKLDEVYQKKEAQRKQELEDQGQWKTLWEEANKTNQEKEQKISTLAQQLEDMKTSNEVASTKTSALSAISNQGAINAEQMLSLLQGKLQKNSEGNVVVLDGGVEQDLNLYLTSLKNPGSGYEHHFKPSTAAGMGAKPSPVGNVSGGSENPWSTGNLTNQLIMENENPDLAAVLKREAQSK